MDASINSSELQSQSDFPGGSPLVIDVRKSPAFHAASEMIAGALRRDPARGADTHKLDLAPQAAGWASISLSLSRTFSDDHEMLKHGMVMYDALYAWCKERQHEVHTWNPGAYRQTS